MQIKKLIVKLVLLLLPFAVILSYIEVKLAAVPNSYNKKRAYLERQLDSIEVLVTGSSHAAYGIDPEYFSRRGFNLGQTAQTLFYDKELILRYASQMKKLKLVIIPVSYFSFYLRMTDGRDAWRDACYKRYWGFSYYRFSHELKYYSCIAMYGTTVTLDNVFHGFNRDMAPNLSPLGFQKIDTTGNTESIGDEIGMKIVIEHEANYSPDKVIEQRNYLEQMIINLKSMGVKVVLITIPTLRNHMEFENRYYQAIKQNNINDICRKYGLVYFDYSNDKRFKEQEFRDNDHLNFLGAKHFSSMLDSEVIQRMLPR